MAGAGAWHSLVRRDRVPRYLELLASSVAIVVSLQLPWAFYRTPAMDSWVPQSHPPIIGLMIQSEQLALAGVAAILLGLLPGPQSRVLLTVAAVLLGLVWLQETIPLIDQRLLGGSPLPGSRFSPAVGYWLLSVGFALTVRGAWIRGRSLDTR